MKEQKEAIAQVLIDDIQLTGASGLLIENRPFFNRAGALSRENSVLPMGMIKTNFNYPILTVQGGGESKRGTKLYDEIIYIRCYNDKIKSYVEIDNVLERVKVILDGYDFNLTNSAHVKTIYEYCSPELIDEGLDLKFREMRFRQYLL